jgi:hypothetical protein
MDLKLPPTGSMEGTGAAHVVNYADPRRSAEHAPRR